MESLLKRALGPAWRLFARLYLGTDKLESREDMDRFATALLNKGL
jgi:hypothetical protein